MAWTVEVSVSFSDEVFMAKLKESVGVATRDAAKRGAYQARRLAPVRKIFNEQLIGRFTKTRTRRTFETLTASQLAHESGIRKQLGLGPKTYKGSVGQYKTSSERTVARTMMSPGWLMTARPRVWAMRRPVLGDPARPKADAWRARHPDSSTALLLNMASMDPRRINRHLELQERAKPLLTSRGRYEVAHAAQRGSITVDRGGVARVGGRLRSEIRDDPGRWLGNLYVAKIISPTPYAKYVEFGTHRAPAQPYMRPAANFVRREYKKMLARAVRNAGGRDVESSKEYKAGGLG